MSVAAGDIMMAAMVGAHLMAVRRAAELALGMTILASVFAVAETLVFLAELW